MATTSQPTSGTLLSHPQAGMLLLIRIQFNSNTTSILESFSYDDAIVRKFAVATAVWGIVGFAAGLYVALLLVLPWLNFELPFLTLGRLRPLHTNAAIFAFAGNAIFAAVYYSTQRLCKARMWE